MKTYTYSEARAHLSDILEESKKEEVVIARRKGDQFVIVPKTPKLRSPFDIEGIKRPITKRAIVDAIRGSRERG